MMPTGIGQVGWSTGSAAQGSTATSRPSRSLVRSQYRPPRTTTCGALDPQGLLFAAWAVSTEPRAVSTARQRRQDEAVHTAVLAVALDGRSHTLATTRAAG